MRSHPVNVSHLVFGLAFLGIAGCWALTEAGVVDARAGWLLPLVLVIAGAVGLVASLVRGIGRAPVATAPFDADEPERGDLPEDEEPTRVL